MQGPTNVFAITIPEMCSRTQILYQDAVPRQEHLDGILAGSLERLPLKWEQGTTVTFQKILVFYEIWLLNVLVRFWIVFMHKVALWEW